MGKIPTLFPYFFVCSASKIKQWVVEGVSTTASVLGFHTTDTVLGDYVLSKKQHQAKCFKILFAQQLFTWW